MATNDVFDDNISANEVGEDNLSELDSGSIELAQSGSENGSDIQPVDANSDQGQDAQQNLVVEQVEVLPEYTPDANNEVRLPETVSVENIEVSGNDLILRQPDGSVITIKNAAANIPTFFLGDIEIPANVLVAALEANGINVAAGPNGSNSAIANPNSSGGNFEDPLTDIGLADPILDLLPYTELAFPEPEEREISRRLLGMSEGIGSCPLASRLRRIAQRAFG